MSGKVHITSEAFSYIGEIENGKDPYFGLELWFLTFFHNKPVWALNREHLAYLIGYLSADLREKPFSIPKKNTSRLSSYFYENGKEQGVYCQASKKYVEKQ